MDPAIAHINHLCLVCHKSTSIWCSRCQNAWYCTSEHFQSDWPRHRQECVPVACSQSNTLTMPRPVPPPVLAILFSPQEDRPQTITVAFDPPHSSAPDACPIPIIQEYLPGVQVDNLVLTQGPNRELLRFPLHLWYSPGALAANTPINQAISYFTSGLASKPWCGPVIVLKYNGSERLGYSDAGIDEFPALLAYFLAYK